MSLPKQPMESPACSKMKPMTVEQEAIYTRYKSDNDFRNECNLKTWRKLWTTHNELIEELKGVTPDANT